MEVMCDRKVCGSRFEVTARVSIAPRRDGACG